MVERFSFFRSNKGIAGITPEGSLSLDQFIDGIRNGTWAKPISLLRLKRSNKQAYKLLKDKLPGVTISALLRTRDAKVPIDRRLKEHSGLIAIDIDKKDNPKLRTNDTIDKEAVAQFVSPGGEGLKLIYRCKRTHDPAEHRRIFDAIVERFKKIGVAINVDPIVKSIVGLQYVSSDPDVYYNPKTKLIVKPLPPIDKKKFKAHSDRSIEQVKLELDEYIKALGKKDVTNDYESWLNVLFGLSYTLGEGGREYAHRICKNYPSYSESETNEKFDSCLESFVAGNVDKPITIASVFKIIAGGISKPKAKQLAKRFNQTHAKPTTNKNSNGKKGGEKSNDKESTVLESPELAGLVKYKLFLFKPTTDKKTGEINDLSIAKLNLNAFEVLLTSLGFYRYQKLFVHIKDNIVEAVDVSDVLYRVTQYIESDGDYNFTYKETEFKFSWEDIAHRWREIRAVPSTSTQIWASLKHWSPNLLKDSAIESYVPYKNGVVVVSAKSIKLLPYKEIKFEVWKERILPRDFKIAKRKGMFEIFFANVMGRGNSIKERIRSEAYRRAVWYYGYMLQGTKRQSTARAWLLYDTIAGNNGRNGKTIVGSAVGYIRSVAVIDGKRVDLNDRFAFQVVKPWTDVILIDDADRKTSLNSLFNMITGTTTADRKNIDPIQAMIKIMITTNWILESAGRSESGRQFVSQVGSFYADYAKDQGNTIQPIVDYHGKEFFTDWDAKDWSEFDTFSLNALQYHLKAKAPENTIIGNSAQVRFCQLYEEETFYDLCVKLIDNAQVISTNGSKATIIVQGVLTEVVREHCPDLKKVGIVAKEFLRSLGAIDISNTTTKQKGGMIRMAWVFKNDLSSLNWGELKNKLPRIN